MYVGVCRDCRVAEVNFRYTDLKGILDHNTLAAVQAPKETFMGSPYYPRPP